MSERVSERVSGRARVGPSVELFDTHRTHARVRTLAVVRQADGSVVADECRARRGRRDQRRGLFQLEALDHGHGLGLHRDEQQDLLDGLSRVRRVHSVIRRRIAIDRVDRVDLQGMLLVRRVAHFVRF